MTPAVSVVVCTHNPREQPLRRALASVAAQSLARERWECIVVDNACVVALCPRLDALSPPDLRPRCVREPRLGLTMARCAGIEASLAELIVFVDDDVVLAPDYLEQALEIFSRHQTLGAAGGRIAGEFEVDPRPWMMESLGNLALRDFGERPIRALVYNDVGPWEPCGAGLVIRKAVASTYARRVAAAGDLSPDRVGTALSSGGDTDMVRTAPDLGLWLAYEPSLRLTHLIPRDRLTLRYLARLAYSIQRDGWMLARRRGSGAHLGRGRVLLEVVLAPLSTLCLSPRRWLIRMASAFGAIRGRQLPVRTSGAPPAGAHD